MRATALAASLLLVACGGGSAKQDGGDSAKGQDATGEGQSDGAADRNGDAAADANVDTAPGDGTADADPSKDAPVEAGDGSAPDGSPADVTADPPAESPTDAPAADTGSGRSFPDTTSTIAILADQLPGGMTSGQQMFAATHFVGTQKLTLALSAPLRAINPAFLVLHYHLAMWQSAPATSFILDGTTWGNDYPTVTTHESWFWHDASSARVASTSDGKLLMNVADTGFRDYWASSIAAQVAAGQYDGVFLDSASPALLSYEAPDARLGGTAARYTAFTELGGLTWIAAWQSWIAALDAALAAKGIPLIPNTGAFVTTWDNTDYGLSAGIFSEGFADPSFSLADWKASTDELLKLSRAGKIMILQNYLGSDGDLARRRYYLANYLLVKATRTYLDYFAGTTLAWYPEWGLDLGAPSAALPTTVDTYLSAGVYRRDFAGGIVLVNPGATPVTVTLGATWKRVVPVGGGPVDTAGTTPGAISTTDVTSISVPATGAEILLR